MTVNYYSLFSFEASDFTDDCKRLVLVLRKDKGRALLQTAGLKQSETASVPATPLCLCALLLQICLRHKSLPHLNNEDETYDECLIFSRQSSSVRHVDDPSFFTAEVSSV